MIVSLVGDCNEQVDAHQAIPRALEYARNVLGYVKASRSEDDPGTSMPLVSVMVCRMSGDCGAINLQEGTRLAGIYRLSRISEEYNCQFGVNPEYLSIFHQSDMTFCGFDDEEDPRALENSDHRFFFRNCVSAGRVRVC